MKRINNQQIVHMLVVLIQLELARLSVINIHV